MDIHKKIFIVCEILVYYIIHNNVLAIFKFLIPFLKFFILYYVDFKNLISNNVLLVWLKWLYHFNEHLKHKSMTPVLLNNNLARLLYFSLVLVEFNDAFNTIRLLLCLFPDAELLNWSEGATSHLLGTSYWLSSPHSLHYTHTTLRGQIITTIVHCCRHLPLELCNHQSSTKEPSALSASIRYLQFRFKMLV